MLFSITEANHSRVSRKRLKSVQVMMLVSSCYPHSPRCFLPPFIRNKRIEARERGTERWGKVRERGSGGESWAAWREGRKERERGREGRGGRENKCIQNDTIKKSKTEVAFFFFFFFLAGGEQSGFLQAEYEHVLCYMIPICQECH